MTSMIIIIAYIIIKSITFHLVRDTHFILLDLFIIIIYCENVNVKIQYAANNPGLDFFPLSKNHPEILLDFTSIQSPQCNAM